MKAVCGTCRCLLSRKCVVKEVPKAAAYFGLVRRFARTAPQTRVAASGDTKQGWESRWRKWTSISTEWKALGAVAIGLISYFINARQDRIQSRKEAKMSLVSRQLKDLYGPLYGNRIVAETSYRSAMKGYGGLRTYLEEARRNKDAEMIRVWRSYVVNVLYPLDKEARNLICTNAHLIAEKEFPKEFDRFLAHSAQMQFLMEMWKNDKGRLETAAEFSENDFLEQTNSTGLGGSKNMISHLRNRCRNLRQQQQQFMEDLSVDTLTMRIVNKVLK